MNLITVTPNFYHGYANVPTFEFSFSEPFPTHSWTVGLYKPVTLDSHLVITEVPGDVRTRYQLVCSDNSGNPNYSYGEYPSGWSSRVSVINKCFDKCLVEAGQMYAIHLCTAIDAIADQYDGLVLMWYGDHAIEREFNIIPWDGTRDISRYVPSSSSYMLIDTAYPGFIPSCDEFFSPYCEML